MSVNPAVFLESSGLNPNWAMSMLPVLWLGFKYIYYHQLNELAWICQDYQSSFVVCSYCLQTLGLFRPYPNSNPIDWQSLVV